MIGVRLFVLFTTLYYVSCTIIRPAGINTNNNIKAAISNMNGPYVIANPNEDDKMPFSTDYSIRNDVEYFEVYSLPINTVYGEVFWTVQDPVPLPQSIIDRFANATFAMIGYEADQVWKTASGGEVSVPIYNSYNHHYEAWLLSSYAKLSFVNGGDYRDTAYNHGAQGHYRAMATSPVPLTPPPVGVPLSQFISEGNGGEYRKSYHGYPNGFAQLVYSPAKFQLQPMQIDTHNRDYHGPGFKAGLLPKASQAPPNATYSGLLECPCTTRISKTWNITYATRLNGTCDTPIGTAAECFMAVTKIGNKPTETRTVTDPTLPTGCLVLNDNSGNITALFNTHLKGVDCGSGDKLQASVSSAVRVSVFLDATVKGGLVTIQMTGPTGVWFGVGFNAVVMADHPYVIVVDGNGVVSEHKVADHAAGTILSPTQATIVSSTVANGLRTVILTRAFAGLTSDHYTFDMTKSNLPIINAVGNTVSFAYHQLKATATLVFTALDAATCVCNDGLHGWINGLAFNKYCAPEPTTDLVEQKNPTCWIQTYVGGLGCCHHKNILLDADQPVDNRVDELYIKFRFYFQPYTPPTPTTPPSHANLHRFYFQTEAWAGEYDIVRCQPGTPPSEAIHEITARWQVKDMMTDCDPKANDPTCVPNKGINLIYAGGHCHAPACLSIELYNADTGDLLCRQVPIVGRGIDPKFDEEGYIAIPPCLWGYDSGLVPPVLLGMETNLMSIKRTNNTDGHYGEMASWQMRGVFV